MKKHFGIFSGIILLLAVLIFTAIFQIEQSAAINFFAAIVAIIPFFINFEKENKKPRDIMPIVVLSAVAIAGRILFTPIPNFKPVTAIVIIIGLAFGAESGFMTGSLTALVSNLFFGQGPWTAWQMLAWGLIGYVAGLLAERKRLKKTWQILVYGILATLFFGVFMDTWTIISYVRPLTLVTVVTSYSLGIVFNISHLVSTIVFLLPIEKLWLPQLKRIKIKFALK
ncbi:MAG: ECF transporter S component [Clostridiaceae bacterium]|nr:ECF transporter S component [Clostridiaceae bacterium]